MKKARSGNGSRADAVVRGLFFLCGSITLVLTILLTLLFLVGGVWGIVKIGLPSFLMGGPGTDSMGLLPLFVSSVYASGGAVLISAPLGILTALFFNYSPARRVAMLARRFFRFMASLPGAVFSVVAIGTLMPFLQAQWGVEQGKSLLAAIVLLAAVMLPEIALESLRILERGKNNVELAALCLGADQMEAAFRVGLAGARYRLCQVVLQAVGRATGQTLAIIMVAGSIANWPQLLQQDVLVNTGVFFALENNNFAFALGLALVFYLAYFALQAVIRVLRHRDGTRTTTQTWEGRFL